MAGHCLKAGYEMVVSSTHAKDAVAKLVKAGAEEVASNAEVGQKSRTHFSLSAQRGCGKKCYR